MFLTLILLRGENWKEVSTVRLRDSRGWKSRNWECSGSIQGAIGAGTGGNDSWLGWPFVDFFSERHVWPMADLGS